MNFNRGRIDLFTLVAGFATATAVSTASLAQVSTTGSITNIAPSPIDLQQNVPAISTVGSVANGTVTVNRANTILNLTDGVNPDIILRVGSNQGTGLLTIDNTATVNLTAGPGDDDAILMISDTPFVSSPPALSGTVNISNGSFLNLTAPDNDPSTNNDAAIAVGRDGSSLLSVTESTGTVTAIGPTASDSAVLNIGGPGAGDNATAVGQVIVTNSLVTLDAQGSGGSFVTVGRGTDTTINNDPATAPENILLIQGGATFNNITTGTGNASFTVGRNGARGTLTVDGSGTALNADNTVSVGRDGGHGTMTVSNGAKANIGGFFSVGRPARVS